MYENERKGRILPTFVTFSPNAKQNIARIFSRSPRDRLHISDSRSFHSCREIVAFDSSLDFTVGCLPLLSMSFFRILKREKRGETLRQEREGTRSCLFRRLLLGFFTRLILDRRIQWGIGASRLIFPP